MRELALFAGAGGGILGGKLLGWRTVCAVEIDAYCRGVLLSRQKDGLLGPFPIWDDIRTFDGGPWRGHVDVVSGGFPCQDISCAGSGTGIKGERSSLWMEMARIVCEVRPRHVFVENSPMLVVRGLDRVLGDLAEMGFDARWGVLGAVHAGAPHKRDRIWIIATNTNGERVRELSGWVGGKGWAEEPTQLANDGETGFVADSYSTRKLQPQGCKQNQRRRSSNCRWWSAEPNMGRVAHGVADRVDRLRSLGNGQVPAVVRLAWETLLERFQGDRSI